MAKPPSFTLEKPFTLETTLGDPAQHRNVEYIESQKAYTEALSDAGWRGMAVPRTRSIFRCWCRLGAS
jgi:hypothetical protein